MISMGADGQEKSTQGKTLEDPSKGPNQPLLTDENQPSGQASSEPANDEISSIVQVNSKHLPRSDKTQTSLKPALNSNLVSSTVQTSSFLALFAALHDSLVKVDQRATGLLYPEFPWRQQVAGDVDDDGKISRKRRKKGRSQSHQALLRIAAPPALDHILPFGMHQRFGSGSLRTGLSSMPFVRTLAPYLTSFYHRCCLKEEEETQRKRSGDSETLHHRRRTPPKVYLDSVEKRTLTLLGYGPAPICRHIDEQIDASADGCTACSPKSKALQKRIASYIYELRLSRQFDRANAVQVLMEKLGILDETVPASPKNGDETAGELRANTGSSKDSRARILSQRQQYILIDDLEKRGKLDKTLVKSKNAGDNNVRVPEEMSPSYGNVVPWLEQDTLLWLLFELADSRPSRRAESLLNNDQSTAREILQERMRRVMHAHTKPLDGTGEDDQPLTFVATTTTDPSVQPPSATSGTIKPSSTAHHRTSTSFFHPSLSSSCLSVSRSMSSVSLAKDALPRSPQSPSPRASTPTQINSSASSPSSLSSASPSSLVYPPASDLRRTDSKLFAQDLTLLHPYNVVYPPNMFSDWSLPVLGDKEVDGLHAAEVCDDSADETLIGEDTLVEGGTRHYYAEDESIDVLGDGFGYDVQELRRGMHATALPKESGSVAEPPMIFRHQHHHHQQQQAASGPALSNDDPLVQQSVEDKDSLEAMDLGEGSHARRNVRTLFGALSHPSDPIPLEDSSPTSSSVFPTSASVSGSPSVSSPSKTTTRIPSTEQRQRYGQSSTGPDAGTSTKMDLSIDNDVLGPEGDDDGEEGGDLWCIVGGEEERRWEPLRSWDDLDADTDADISDDTENTPSDSYVGNHATSKLSCGIMDEEDFVKQCLKLVIGIPTRMFRYDSHERKFVVRGAPLRISGVTVPSLEGVVNRLCNMGTHFKRLEHVVEVVKGDVSVGVIAETVLNDEGDAGATPTAKRTSSHSKETCDDDGVDDRTWVEDEATMEPDEADNVTETSKRHCRMLRLYHAMETLTYVLEALATLFWCHVDDEPPHLSKHIRNVHGTPSSMQAKDKTAQDRPQPQQRQQMDHTHLSDEIVHDVEIYQEWLSNGFYIPTKAGELLTFLYETAVELDALSPVSSGSQVTSSSPNRISPKETIMRAVVVTLLERTSWPYFRWLEKWIGLGVATSTVGDSKGAHVNSTGSADRSTAPQTMLKSRPPQNSVTDKVAVDMALEVSSALTGVGMNLLDNGACDPYGEFFARYIPPRDAEDEGESTFSYGSSGAGERNTDGGESSDPSSSRVSPPWMKDLIGSSSSIFGGEKLSTLMDASAISGAGSSAGASARNLRRRKSTSGIMLEQEVRDAIFLTGDAFWAFGWQVNE
ncbi:hypothetical protein HK102_009312 [Quaeritorhiza haematococci]|nr:hypothetical protein HK102_009312 [Quaeritorhiza haematococci]